MRLWGEAMSESNREYEIDKIQMRITSVRPHATNKVTEHPVESGSVISDMLVRMPVKLSVRGLVAKREIRQLISAQESWQELFTVRTPDRTYKDLAVSGISYSKTSDKWDMVEAEVDFTQIRFTKTAATTSSPDDASSR